jgi:hypothetical protein
MSSAVETSLTFPGARSISRNYDEVRDFSTSLEMTQGHDLLQNYRTDPRESRYSIVVDCAPYVMSSAVETSLTFPGARSISRNYDEVRDFSTSLEMTQGHDLLQNYRTDPRGIPGGGGGIISR